MRASIDFRRVWTFTTIRAIFHISSVNAACKLRCAVLRGVLNAEYQLAVISMNTWIRTALIAVFAIVCTISAVIYWGDLADNAFGLIVGLIAGVILTAIYGYLFGTRHESMSQSEYDATAQKDDSTIYYVVSEGKSNRESRWVKAARRFRRLLPRSSRPAR